MRPAVEGQCLEIPHVTFVPEAVSFYVRRLITSQKGNNREFGVLHLHLQPLEPDCRELDLCGDETVLCRFSFLSYG